MASRKPEPPPFAQGQTSWQGFVDTVMKKRPLLGALLCHGEFRLDPGKKITLTFAKSSFYERQISEPKTQTEVEVMIKNYFGPEATLSFMSGDKRLNSLETGRQEEVNQLTADALNHPAVLQMKEKLGAEVVSVKVDL
jgi:hypothetical protein